MASIKAGTCFTGTMLLKMSLNCRFFKANYFCQEPVLFDRSIAENIKYGDNSREVSMEEVLKYIEVKN